MLEEESLGTAWRYHVDSKQTSALVSIAQSHHPSFSPQGEEHMLEEEILRKPDLAQDKLLARMRKVTCAQAAATFAPCTGFRAYKVSCIGSAH